MTEKAIQDAERQVKNLAKAVAQSGWSGAVGQELGEAEAEFCELPKKRVRRWS